MVHEAVEDSAGEDPAQTATLKNQRRIVINHHDANLGKVYLGKILVSA